jgi:hypothetical protein
MFTLICEGVKREVPVETVNKIPVLVDVIADLQTTEVELPWLAVAGLDAIVAALENDVIPPVDTVEAFECARIEVRDCLPYALVYEKEILANGAKFWGDGLMNFDHTIINAKKGEHAVVFNEKLKLLAADLPGTNSVLVGATVARLLYLNLLDDVDERQLHFYDQTPEKAEDQLRTLHTSLHARSAIYSVTRHNRAITINNVKVSFDIHPTLSDLLHRLPEDVPAVAFDGTKIILTRRWLYYFEHRDDLLQTKDVEYTPLRYYIQSLYCKLLTDKKADEAKMFAQGFLDYHYSKSDCTDKVTIMRMWNCIGDTLGSCSYEDEHEHCSCELWGTAVAAEGTKITAFWLAIDNGLTVTPKPLRAVTPKPLRAVNPQLLVYLSTFAELGFTATLDFRVI